MENPNNEGTQVIETTDIEIEYDEDNRKKVNGYLFLETIGKGSYAKVKLASKNSRFYAIKIVNQNLLEKKKKGFSKDSDGNLVINNMLKDALQEIVILKKISHKNIIKLYEIMRDSETNKIYLGINYKIMMASNGICIKRIYYGV
jgi:[calcium/calmodulin-dependent protein kinase] kinase